MRYSTAPKIPLKWFPIAKTDELAPGKSKLIEIHNCEIALFNVDGSFYAIRDFCPHLGGSLAKGDLTGKVIKCPLHYALFDVTNGSIVRGPSKGPVDTYPVRVTDTEVAVGLTETQIERGF